MSLQSVRNIISVNINDEMKSAYLDYAMSVIVSRALPDVRDGMKPVHRRVLFAMYEQNNVAGKPYKKSARIVGDVLGKYHPHGDTAVYDALVRLAQDFSMRYPLIDGQGNFGSIDGDSPAAMRYTEVRLAKVADALMQSIEEDTVDFVPNYDNSEREPQILPTVFPQLLVNGQSGIAVGMATNIPPHNLGEILEALLILVDNESATIDDLMRCVKGPDFPTAGIICGRRGILDAYRTGRGSIIVRGRASVETVKNGKEQIVITELPYQVNKANLIEKIAELVKQEEVSGISDIRDESNKEGIRIVIDLKKNENGEVVLNHLYKKTRLQDSFGVNIVCIVKGVPKLLNLKECLEAFRDHRYEVIVRRTHFRLRKANDRLHILEGLKIAVENLDNFVSLIRSSESPDAAKSKLIEKYSVSDKQAAAVLEMRLSRLTALEREKILEEHRQLIVSIEDLQDILSKPERVRSITKEEFTFLKDSFADGRRTEIVADVGTDLDIASLIPPADVFVTFSASGYIKRVNEVEFRSQHRAGKGKAAVSLKESDHIKFTFRAHTHDHVLMFSTLGKVYCFRIYELPEASAASRGKSIAQILTLQAGEEIAVMMPLREFKENSYIFMVTRQGIVKKTELTSFANIRTSGLRAITIDDDDSLLSAMVTTGSEEIIMATEDGMAIRFNENEVRPTGRSARGVIGINLDENDKVVATAVVHPTDELLVVTEFGFGKRSPVEDYRLTTRAKKGVKALRVTSRNGRISGILAASDNTDVMITTSTGRVLRTPVNSIRVIGRLTQGVCLMRVLETERIVSVCKPNEGDETPVSVLESQEDID